MIVSGFVEPITKELPLEYAVELNRLIQLQMEGVGRLIEVERTDFVSVPVTRSRPVGAVLRRDPRPRRDPKATRRPEFETWKRHLCLVDRSQDRV